MKYSSADRFGIRTRASTLPQSKSGSDPGFGIQSDSIRLGRFLKSGGVFLRGEKGEIHPHISPKTFLKL